MLNYLSDFEQYFGPLRLVRAITFRTLMAAGTATLLGFLIGPWLIARLRRLKFGQNYDDHRVGELAARFDKKNTPTMGGLLIFFSVFGATFLWASPNVWVVVAMFVYVALTGVGFRDDYLKVTGRSSRGISSGEKILWQTIITVIALAAILWNPVSAEKIREFWVPFYKEPAWIFTGGLGFVALLALIFFWIVGFSNAINLTDGLDGLAVGCSITVALVYGIMAYVAGRVDPSAPSSPPMAAPCLSSRSRMPVLKPNAPCCGFSTIRK